MKAEYRRALVRDCVLLVLGSAILAFGLFNVHSLSDITEGGVLGLTLLFDHLFHLSPAVTSLLLNGICYFIGWRVLGKRFIAYSAASAALFSTFYAFFEWIGPLFPQIAEINILAAVLGAVFVGVGVGLCVRAGAAPTGDDALAMSISKGTGLNIRWTYLIADLTVLLLSLLYIPLTKILYSLVTVILSGQIVGLIEGFGKAKK